ncbi:hypothetical protein KEM52_003461 [Ascosphaera acerosa]|nr:hypothetical protein KEM52_003461 [Ascosphaera acerosa]
MMERRVVLDSLAKEYEKQIVEGHSERCPWRLKGCDDTIQHLSLTRPETAMSALKERYHKLSALGSKLPAPDRIRTPIAESTMQEVIQHLPQRFLHTPADPAKENAQQQGNAARPAATDGDQSLQISAFVLALFGWEPDSESASLKVVTCAACFRRLGLWTYASEQDKAKATTATATVDDASTADASDQNDDAATLDAAAEHEDYCPWINKITQSCDAAGRINTLSKINPPRPGYEALVQAIRILHRRLLWSEPTSGTETAQSAQPVGRVSEETAVDEEARKQQDRDWWAKMRRLREVLRVRGLKRTGDGRPATPSTSTSSTIA